MTADRTATMTTKPVATLEHQHSVLAIGLGLPHVAVFTRLYLRPNSLDGPDHFVGSPWVRVVEVGLLRLTVYCVSMSKTWQTLWRTLWHFGITLEYLCRQSVL